MGVAAAVDGRVLRRKTQGAPVCRMPLHSGYTVEEQIEPGAAVGGIRLVVIPLKAAIYEQRKADRLRAGSPEPLTGALPAACADMGLGAGGNRAVDRDAR